MRRARWLHHAGHRRRREVPRHQRSEDRYPEARLGPRTPPIWSTPPAHGTASLRSACTRSRTVAFLAELTAEMLLEILAMTSPSSQFRPTIDRIIAEAENMLNALGKLEDRNRVRTVLIEPHVVKGGEAQHVGSSISTTVGRFVGQPPPRRKLNTIDVGWRRGGDSNPRDQSPSLPHFECGAFNHSATSPSADRESKARL